MADDRREGSGAAGPELIHEMALRDAMRFWRLYDWSVQGFGMLRCYLDPYQRYRLNFWHESLRVPNVSVIHDHPWSFVSYVLRGELTNIKYTEDSDRHAGHDDPFRFSWLRIVTGEHGGRPVDFLEERDTGTSLLYSQPPIVYRPGDCYGQRLDEIHETRFTNGTVTLNDRTPPSEAHDARVFFPHDSEWGDAKPRAATPAEIARVLAAVGV